MMRTNKALRARAIVGFALLLPLLAGCGSNEDKQANSAMGTMEGHAMGTETKGASPSAGTATEEPKKQYTLNATLEQEGEGYVIQVDSDLSFSEEHYGGAHVYGEGHIHFYLNGSLNGPIMKNGPFQIPDYLLSSGEHTIKLALAGNDHSEPYNATAELKLTIE